MIRQSSSPGRPKLWPKALCTGLLGGASITIVIWILAMFFGGWTVWFGLSQFLPQDCKINMISNPNITDVKNTSDVTHTGPVDNRRNDSPLCDPSLTLTICIILLIGGSIVFCGIFLYYCLTFAKAKYKYLKNEENIKYYSDPQYLQNLINDVENNASITKILNENDKLLEEFIIQMVHNTWIYKSRAGKDSTSLTHKTLNINNILRVHNEKLWESYNSTYHNVDVYDCPKQLKTRPIMTALPRVLDNEIDIEAHTGNESICKLRPGEVYLFHGTKLENINAITENGFDTTKMRCGLYGKAIYMAESSEKADQYTDYREYRRNHQLAMLILRVNMGRILYHDTQLSMIEELETLTRSQQQNGTFYDTVIAGHNKRFREFLVFDPKRCYPEFIVIYDRE